MDIPKWFVLITLPFFCLLDLCMFEIWQFMFSLMACILHSFIIQYFQGREGLKLSPEKIKHIFYMHEFVIFICSFFNPSSRKASLISPIGLGKSPLFRIPMLPWAYLYYRLDFTLDSLREEFVWYLSLISSLYDDLALITNLSLVLCLM